MGLTPLFKFLKERLLTLVANFLLATAKGDLVPVEKARGIARNICELETLRDGEMSEYSRLLFNYLVDRRLPIAATTYEKMRDHKTELLEEIQNNTHRKDCPDGV